VSTPAETSGTTRHPDVSEVSVGTIVSELASDMSTLIRKEIELAKVEVKAEAVKAGKAGGAFGGAGFAGWMAVLFLSWALTYLLDELMPRGLAVLIVGVLWLVGAIALALYGRARVRALNPVPERTVETVKEDVEWLKNRKS
jgi:predicted butyrate kinase (DUF1464 family)